MVADKEYVERVKDYGWSDVAALWDDVLDCRTPEWDSGKALEYVVLKGFELSGATVRWPYAVTLLESTHVEQIDGMVYVAGIAAMVECKDFATSSNRARLSVGHDPIAKLQGRLTRRPSTLVGCLFTSGRYSEAAILMSHFTKPATILCRNGDDIAQCVSRRDFAGALTHKYRACLEEGDHHAGVHSREGAL